MQGNSLNHFKSVFAHKFFVHPADSNYFIARLTRIFGLHEEFYWQSMQCIEKYLKASLITNDIDTRKIRHRISEAFDIHRNNFGALAISDFIKPADLKEQHWRAETPERFVNRIEQYGHPDTRYGLVSWSNEPSDLFKLDQLVFSIRRLTIGLDWIVGQDWQLDSDEMGY